ncbi:MAG: hypothetical protein NUW21_07610, partial [Elusimicrobia bacterium]|nr:hypothetical protein [Elusimicrobiota bacterium]
ALADLKAKAKGDGGMGRNGDKHEVHVNDSELAMLHYMTDGGSINPKTGMMEFFGGASEDAGQDSGPEDDDGSSDGDDEIGGFMESIAGDPNPGNIDDKDRNVDGAPGDKQTNWGEEAAYGALSALGFLVGGIPGAIISAPSTIRTGGKLVDALKNSKPSEGPQGRGGTGEDTAGGLGGEGATKTKPVDPEKSSPLAATGGEESPRRKSRRSTLITGGKGLLGEATVERPYARGGARLLG